MSSTASGIKLDFKNKSDRLEVQLRERRGLRWRDALPFHKAAMLRHSPFIVGRGCGNGTAILVLVGVQHEVALGGVECVISGMSGSVVKTAVRSILLRPSLMSTKFPAAVASIRVRALQPVTI